MRTIKFKYYFQIHTREGVEINPVIFSLDEIEKRQFTHNDDSLIYKVQFTGLKDKNGKEIYEGDILSEKWKAEVYQNDEGMFMVKFGTHPELNKPRSLKKYLTSRKKAGSEDTDCIIIGNIHQNPELLK